MVFFEEKEMHFENLNELLLYLQTTQKRIVIFGAGQLGKNWAYDFFVDRGILIDAYCDNNSSLWGQRVHGKKVMSPNELANISNNVIALVIIRWDAVDLVVNQLKKIGITEIIDYPTLVHLEGMKEEYFPFLHKKNVVYTCVTNGYDNIFDHDFISDKFDYFVISDKEPENPGIFTYLDIGEFLPEGINDPTRQNRYCKINAHKIFPQYRYSIYADANIIFTKSIAQVIDKLPKTRLAVSSKLLDDDLYTHAIRIMNGRRDEPEIIRKQMEHYYLMGMPEHFGNYWCNVLVREHNHPVCSKIMEDWWDEIMQFTRRDQLSLPYVIWKNGYTYSDVGIIDSKFHLTLKPQYWEYLVNHKKSWAIC